MKICLNVGIGSGKAECEDTAVFNNTLINNKTILLDSDLFQCVGVADGVGGNAGGRIASRYIAHKVSQADFFSMTQRDIHAFVTDINMNLIDYAESIPNKSKMATTLTCVVATKDGYYLIHAGNTRLYVMQGSYLKQLTTDHLSQRYGEKNGTLSEGWTDCRSESQCFSRTSRIQKYAERMWLYS